MTICRRLLAGIFVLTLNLCPVAFAARADPSQKEPVTHNSAPVSQTASKSDDDTDSLVITNPQFVAIPDDAYNGNLATMACSDIITTSTVPAGSVIYSARVSVGLDHTWIGDLTMKLIAPSGEILTILNRPGSSAPDNGADTPVGDSSNWAAGTVISFGDGLGPEAETIGSTIADAQNVCTNDGVCAYDPSPDTAATPPTAFSSLRSTSASGVWRLCVGDSNLLDTGNLRTWTLDLNYANVFSINPSPNSIPDDGYVGGFGGVGQFCSTITVPPLSGGATVQGVFLNISATHTWVGDLTMKLRSPSGTIFTFLNRPGSTAADDGGGAVGNNANWAGTLTFGDGFGPEAETMGAGLVTGQIVCIANGICSFDPSPDTAVSPASFAAAFNGQTAAGNWTLCAGDSALGDTGVVSNWRLNLVNALAPTAAGVTVSGRVFSPLGSTISKARVTITNSRGDGQTVLTNPFGYYSFDDVTAGTTYFITVEAKGYTFEPRTVTIADEITNLDFIGQPGLFHKQQE